MEQEQEYFDESELISGFVEIRLKSPGDFLKVKETLTRIGIASYPSKDESSTRPRLFQSCHILHKRGKYYLVHFKELLELDGFETNFDESDLARRNTISNLLCEWGLLELIDPAKSKAPASPLHLIKIVGFKDKGNWDLIPKYHIGKKKA